MKSQQKYWSDGSYRLDTNAQTSIDTKDIEIDTAQPCQAVRLPKRTRFPMCSQDRCDWGKKQKRKQKDMLETRHEGRKRRGRGGEGQKTEADWHESQAARRLVDGQTQQRKRGAGRLSSQAAWTLPPRGDSDFKPLPCFIFPPGYCSQINLAGLPAVAQPSSAPLLGPRSPPYGVENSEEQVGGSQIC